jgi:hypothetical protein
MQFRIICSYCKSDHFGAKGIKEKCEKRKELRKGDEKTHVNKELSPLTFINEDQ